MTKEGARAGQKSNELFSNLDWMVSSNTPVIAVRMPDGAFVRTDQIRKESFAPYLASGHAHVGEGWDITVNFPHGEALILFGEDGSLKRLQLWSRGDHGDQDGDAGGYPAIQAIESGKVLTLPVSERDLIEAFGKPTQDRTWTLNT